MKVFTTIAGEQIEYGPILLEDLQLAQNAVEREFREHGEPLDPPTYEVDVLGGEKEYHSHTAETIAEASDEEKEQWRLYLDAKQRLGTATEERTALIFLEAMKVELPEDDSWIKRRKRLFNDEIPEDAEQRLLYYVNKVLLKTPADRNGIVEAILDLSMSGTSEEVKQAYKDLFRRQMEVQGRAIAEIIKANEGPGQEMVLQQLDAKLSGSQSMGNDAKRIQELIREGQIGNDSIGGNSG